MTSDFGIKLAALLHEELDGLVRADIDRMLLDASVEIGVCEPEPDLPDEPGVGDLYIVVNDETYSWNLQEAVDGAIRAVYEDWAETHNPQAVLKKLARIFRTSAEAFEQAAQDPS